MALSIKHERYGIRYFLQCILKWYETIWDTDDIILKVYRTRKSQLSLSFLINFKHFWAYIMSLSTKRHSFGIRFVFLPHSEIISDNTWSICMTVQHKEIASFFKIYLPHPVIASIANLMSLSAKHQSYGKGLVFPVHSERISDSTWYRWYNINSVSH